MKIEGNKNKGHAKLRYSIRFDSKVMGRFENLIACRSQTTQTVNGA